MSLGISGIGVILWIYFSFSSVGTHTYLFLKPRLVQDYLFSYLISPGYSFIELFSLVNQMVVHLLILFLSLFCTIITYLNEVLLLKEFKCQILQIIHCVMKEMNRNWTNSVFLSLSFE